jgi:hypothetical protein
MLSAAKHLIVVGTNGILRFAQNDIYFVFSAASMRWRNFAR